MVPNDDDDDDEPRSSHVKWKKRKTSKPKIIPPTSVRRTA
jgi:hypothetical protein